MKKNVLLVEDGRDIQLLVRSALGDKVELTCVDNATTATKELENRKYDLLLLDVNLPDANGFDFCKKLRAKENFGDLPIFFLTGANDLKDKKVGFDVGADDYVTKPFEPEELEARVMAKLARTKSIKQDKIVVDGFRVDLVQHKVYRKNAEGLEEALPLTPLEFRLLSLFLQHEGKVFSRQELLKLFWGDEVHVSRNTVDTHISSLRKKMGEDGSFIKSIFKKGYSFARASKKTSFSSSNGPLN